MAQGAPGFSGFRRSDGGRGLDLLREGIGSAVQPSHKFVLELGHLARPIRMKGVSELRHVEVPVAAPADGDLHVALE